MQTSVLNNDQIIHVAQKLLEFQQLPQNRETLRPCFLGPSGCGKTARVRILAEKMGLPLLALELQSMMPEDLIGRPILTHTAEGTVQVQSFAPPAWLQKVSETPHVLFLDEFDKAREELMSVILTLLWEGRLGDVNIHPETVIVTAMQPPESNWDQSATGDAIAGRLIFLPITYDRERLRVKFGVDLTHLECKIPTPPTGVDVKDRSIEWFLSFVTHNPELMKDEYLDYLLTGLIPESMIPGVLEALKKVWNMDIKVIVENGRDDILVDLPIQEMIKNLGPYAMNAGQVKIFADMMARITIEGGLEAGQQAMEEFHRSLTEKHPDELFGEETAETVTLALNDMNRRIGMHYLAEAQKEGGVSATV